MVDERFKWMLDNHQGLVVYKDNILVGYMMYILGDELFGNQKCAFVPLFGHASIEEDQMKIYRTLYLHASKNWLKNKRLSWVITSFEHNQDLEKFWFKNGFGQRCADAIALLQASKEEDDIVTIKKANLNTLNDIADLHREHSAYYQQAPLCMPGDDSDAFEELKAWFNEDNHHLWIAYMNNQALGYMRIEEKGESFITLVEDMVSVTSAYVDPEKRSLGIGSKLLSHVQNYIINDLKMKRYGVDYESLNPLAYGFWEKHFMPFTKTLTRRIDEGILK
jgi:ribosomal protein S18 acetylase RimI-like enzyme